MRRCSIEHWTVGKAAGRARYRRRVLIVDNNCTDDTAGVVEKHRRSNLLRLRILVEPRQGLTPARLCGVTNTAADWLAFLDDECAGRKS